MTVSRRRAAHRHFTWGADGARVLRHLHGRVAVGLATVALAAGVLAEVTGRDGVLGDLGVAALVIALAVFAVAVPWAFGRPWEEQDSRRETRRR